MFKIGDKVKYIGERYIMIKNKIGIIKDAGSGKVTVYYPDLKDGEYVGNGVSLHNCCGEYDEKKYLYIDTLGLELIEEVEEDKMFKVGDKVRIIQNTLSHIFRVGDITEIDSIINENMYKCKDERGYTWNVPKRDIEPVKEFYSSHYEGEIEPIQFIMANKMSFNRGNIIKYATRAGKKSGQEKLDIHKIIDYAMLMAFEEGIDIKESEILDLVKYRFNWEKDKGDK